METTIFDDQSIARKLFRVRVLRIPVILLVAVLVTGVVTAAVLIGPPSARENQNISVAIPGIVGLNANPFYGQIVGNVQFWFNVTVATNTYKIAENMRPLITVTNLSAATDVVLIASTNGVSYSFTNPTVTQNGANFTMDFGPSFEQNVPAQATGPAAPTWYFQFHYTVSNLPATVVTWTAQFVTGA